MAGERNNITVIVGKPSSGKSTLARRLVGGPYLSRRRKIAVVDPMGEYGSLPGFSVTKYGRAAAGRVAWSRLLKDHPRVAVETGGLVGREIPEMLDGLSLAIYEAGHSLLVIDEAWQYVPQHGCSEELERLLRGGRHRWCDVLLVTQRPADLNVAALSLASMIVAFQLTEENDLAKMRGYLSAQETAALATLPAGRFLAKNTRSGQVETGRIF